MVGLVPGGVGEGDQVAVGLAGVVGGLSDTSRTGGRRDDSRFCGGLYDGLVGDFGGFLGGGWGRRRFAVQGADLKLWPVFLKDAFVVVLRQIRMLALGWRWASKVDWVSSFEDWEAGRK